MDESLPSAACDSCTELPRGTIRRRLSRPITRRLSVWIVTTIAMQAVVLIAYPAFICGCHFDPVAFWISLSPIVWGIYCFSFYRTKPERILSYVALAFSVAWAWVAWHTNIMFYFR